MDGEQVPMVDLQAQYRRVRSEIDPAIAQILDSAQFVRGPECGAFERELADYCGTAHAIGVASGTDALRLALWALGVGPGDEVVTVAFTFIATAEAITQNGARPVFVDVDPVRYTMDPQALASAVTRKTRAILPVHLYGQPADMGAICAVAADAGVPVIEDAAQAHGARFQGRQVGRLGLAACFSFYPGKNLGAFGDAGAVVGDDTALLDRVRSLADHGAGRDKYDNRLAGTNSRLDALQAAVLRVKLRHLDAWNAERRERVEAYREALMGVEPVVLPEEAGDVRSAWHQFVIRARDRDGLRRHLAARGIASAVHYPVPLHRCAGMAAIARTAGELPVTERLALEVLSLPLFPELPLATLRRIAGEIRAFYGC